MVDGVFGSLDFPVQPVCRGRSAQRKTIADAGLDLGAFFVVVPGHKLQIGQLLSRVVQPIDLGESLQPGLAALLAHDPVRTPGCKRVIEAFVGCAHSLLSGISKARIVKVGEVTHAVIGLRGHDPGIAAVTEYMREPAAILEKKQRMRTQRAVHRGPVDGVVVVDIKIRNHRNPIFRHVRRRCEISLLHILQFVDQGLLRGASAAGVFRNRPFVHGDRKSKSGMAFRGRHYELRCLIFGIVRSVPVDDHAINAAADHVVDLAVDLVRVGRTVAHVHMIRLSEPDHQVGVDLGTVSRIQQGMHVDFADVSCA